METRDTEERRAYFVKTAKGNIELKYCILCCESNIEDTKHITCPTMNKDFEGKTSVELKNLAEGCELYQPRSIEARQTFDQMMRAMKNHGVIPNDELDKNDIIATPVAPVSRM